MSTTATSGSVAATLLEQLDRPACLGDDPHPGLLEQPGDAVANEHRVVREHDAETVVVDAAAEAEGRKVGGKAVGEELEQALRLRQAGELVSAEVAHVDAGERGALSPREAPGRRGRSSSDARPVEVQPDISIAVVDRSTPCACPCGLARPPRRASRSEDRALGGGGGRDGGGGRVEDGERLVGTALDLLAVVGRHGASEDLAQRRKDVAVVADQVGGRATSNARCR